jgi:hypothetical protein
VRAGGCVHALVAVRRRFREVSLLCPFIYLVRFDLPCSVGTLPTPLGKYVNIRATIGGEVVTRSYSPISRPSAVGHVDFLIKVRAVARHTLPPPPPPPIFRPRVGSPPKALPPSCGAMRFRSRGG